MAGESGPRYPEEAVYTLTELEQIRVLADPLRLRILEAFCEERTTKQVAEQLGERPTKLYHHVEALERVGLVRLTRTRPNRGTLEKYYLAVARSFRADSRLFSAADAEGAEGDGASGAESMKQMVGGIFDRTANELARLLDVRGLEHLEAEGIVTHVTLELEERHVKRIQRRFKRLLDDLGKLGEEAIKAAAAGEAPRSERRYRLTLAYYPVDRLEDEPPPGGSA
jgi:DNA-binding transcriptional ArsR family regulator